MINNNKIMWVDDEIDLLKSHIIYLESKGYNVISVNSGEDAIEQCKIEDVNLILLDEMMTGLDGISTLRIIKENYPDLPIIMVTKNEEEWLMDEAISEQITDYLIKPVHPNQILMACKKVLENDQISSEKTMKDFLQYYNEIQNINIKQMDYHDWFSTYNKLCDWFIKLERIDNNDFIDMLNEQKMILNKQFIGFVLNNYKYWISNPLNRPVISSDIFNHSLKPHINNNKQVVFVIIDCLRLDQWKKISQFFKNKFTINEDFHLSILPTATPFARNSIFSGMLPSEIKNNNIELWKKMFLDNGYNKHEEELFNMLLEKSGFKDKSFSYIKISDYLSGKKFYNKINDYKNKDILGIVVNFVDILGHSRSESQVLKELIPNESAYRQSIYNWFQNSWLKDCFNQFLEWNSEIIITSDHGNTLVDKPVVVKADHTVSSGVRYKYGRNLNINNKNILKIQDPELFGLPKFDVNTEYVISTDNNFLVYSNQYHKYINLYKQTFQHGGISMDEMITPLIHLKKG